MPPLIEYPVSLSNADKGNLLEGNSHSIRVDGPLWVEVRRGGVKIIRDGRKIWSCWLEPETKAGTAEEGDIIEAFQFSMIITDRM